MIGRLVVQMVGRDGLGGEGGVARFHGAEVGARKVVRRDDWTHGLIM
jgi:hypothetical protein